MQGHHMRGILEEAMGPIHDADDFPAEGVGAQDGGTQDGVKPGAIAAAGQDGNAFFGRCHKISSGNRLEQRNSSCLKAFSKHNRGKRVVFLLCSTAFRDHETAQSMNEQDKLQDLLVELKAEHRDLDDAIHALSMRGVPDMIQIQRLKKRKLVLKDEIMHIESKLLPDIIA
jgi:hypothetical protein